MNDVRLDGDVAIVTGSGRGLGRAHALELARRGARVVVNDVDAAAAAEVVSEIGDAGGTAVVCTESAAGYDGTAAIVEHALDAFEDLTVLVNNAGVFPLGHFEELTPEALTDTVNVHLLGYFWLTQHAWRVFVRKGYGRVVMTSSSAGLFANPGLANYAAVKAGVYGLGRALASEGATVGIKVNTILPSGATKPDLASPLADFDQQFPDIDRALHGRRSPALVSPLVAYLASRQCAVNGATFTALGGRYAGVFAGVTDGWLPRHVEEASAEAIRDHLDEIMDLASFTVPASTMDEINGVAARLDELERRQQDGVHADPPAGGGA